MAPLPIPEELGAAGAKLWEDLTASYAYDAGEVVLLLGACRLADRLESARRAVKRDGVFVTSARDGGRKAHPALTVERVTLGALARLLRQLAPGPEAASWPPRRRGGMSR